MAFQKCSGKLGRRTRASAPTIVGLLGNGERIFSAIRLGDALSLLRVGRIRGTGSEREIGSFARRIRRLGPAVADPTLSGVVLSFSFLLLLQIWQVLNHKPLSAASIRRFCRWYHTLDRWTAIGISAVSICPMPEGTFTTHVIMLLHSTTNSTSCPRPAPHRSANLHANPSLRNAFGS